MLSVYTIGHSNHPVEKFLKLLTDAHIQELVDVRSNPHSLYATYTSPKELSEILGRISIQYIFLGKSLGGKPDNSEYYDSSTGKPDYALIRAGNTLQEGIDRVTDEIVKYRVCLMCAEENPISCHRNLLVGESLRQKGIQLFHIRGTGQIQTDKDLLKEKIGVSNNQLALPL